MLGFSDSVVDNGISVSEVIRPGIAFRARIASLAVDNDGAEDQDEEKKDLKTENGNGQQDMDRVVDLQFLVKGLELDHRDRKSVV